jgi:4-amino-4-deoxy-L-arabinose transferase-like glycosyltransferase
MLINLALAVSACIFGVLAYHHESLFMVAIAAFQGGLLLREANIRRWLWLVLPLLLAVLAQYRFTAAQPGSAILGAVAAGLWLNVIVKPGTDHVLLASPARFGWTRQRVSLAGAGGLFSLGTFFLAASSGMFTWLLLICWLASVAVWWIALQEQVKFTLPAVSTIAADRLAIVVVLLAVGAFSFFYRLDSAPAGMLGDHGAKLMDIENMVNGQLPIYFNGNFGREPLHFYLAYLNSPLFDLTFLNLKIVSAAIAMLTLVALYWAGTQVDGRLTGILAMGLGAGSLWLMILGRNGFRAGEAALMTALLLGLLWRALHAGRRTDFLLAGLILGAGMYTYMAFRLVPLLVVVGFGLRFIAGGGRLRLAGNMLALGVMAAVVYMPLLGYWAFDPEGYWNRADHLFKDASVERIWFGLHRSLGMFNFNNDVVWFNVTPGHPALGPVVGALLLLGVALWLRRGWVNRMALLLPLAVVITILPSALAVGAPVELPNALRSVTALPVALLVAASALAFALRRLSKSHAVIVLVGGAVLLVNGAINWNIYHSEYIPNYNWRTARELHAAQQIEQFEHLGGSRWSAFVVTDDPFMHIYVTAIAGELGHPWTWRNYLNGIETERCPPLAAQKPYFFVLDYRDPAFGETVHDWLDRCYPGHSRHDYFYDADRKLFEIAYVFD